MEDDLKKIKNGRRPQNNIIEEDLQKNERRPQKIGRRPQAQLNKSTLIGCDIIVN